MLTQIRIGKAGLGFPRDEFPLASEPIRLPGLFARSLPGGLRDQVRAHGDRSGRRHVRRAGRAHDQGRGDLQGQADLLRTRRTSCSSPGSWLGRKGRFCSCRPGPPPMRSHARGFRCRRAGRGAALAKGSRPIRQRRQADVVARGGRGARTGSPDEIVGEYQSGGRWQLPREHGGAGRESTYENGQLAEVRIYPLDLGQTPRPMSQLGIPRRRHRRCRRRSSMK